MLHVSRNITIREFENPDHWDTAARHNEKTAHPSTTATPYDMVGTYNKDASRYFAGTISDHFR